MDFRAACHPVAYCCQLDQMTVHQRGSFQRLMHTSAQAMYGAHSVSLVTALQSPACSLETESRTRLTNSDALLFDQVGPACSEPVVALGGRNKAFILHQPGLPVLVHNADLVLEQGLVHIRQWRLQAYSTGR